jgi:hypothetical protein
MTGFCASRLSINYSTPKQGGSFLTDYEARPHRRPWLSEAARGEAPSTANVELNTLSLETYSLSVLVTAPREFPSFSHSNIQSLSRRFMLSSMVSLSFLRDIWSS